MDEEELKATLKRTVELLEWVGAERDALKKANDELMKDNKELLNQLTNPVYVTDVTDNFVRGND